MMLKNREKKKKRIDGKFEGSRHVIQTDSEHSYTIAVEVIAKTETDLQIIKTKYAI